MNIFLLAWRRLCYKPWQNILAIGIMGLSIAFALLTLLLSNGLHRGIVTAGEPFPLVIGAKGSPNQLLLNTVFLKDMPMNNMDYSVVESLRKNKFVKEAIPLAYGDNYKGYRIVGTEKELFTHKVKANAENYWLNISQGKVFSETGEAVIGSQVAQDTNLKIGDMFTTAHGVVQYKGMKSHGKNMKVVGILAPVKGPYDNSILVNIKGIWEMHEKNHTGHDAVEEQHEGAEGDVTAILVKPRGYSEAMNLAANYAKSNQVQVLFPAKQIIELFNIMGGGEKLLTFLSYGALGLALLLVIFSLYWLIATSKEEEGIFRSLGASQMLLVKLYSLIGVFMVIMGGFWGFFLGRGGYYLLGTYLSHKAGVFLPMDFIPQEVYLLGGILVVGSLCSFIPALIERKKELISDLQ